MRWRCAVGAVAAAGLLVGCGAKDTGGTVGGGRAATSIGNNVPNGSTLLTAQLTGPSGVTGTARVRLDPPVMQVCADLTVSGSAPGPAQILTKSGQVAVALKAPKPSISSTCVIVVQELFTQLGPGAIVQVGPLKGTLAP